MKELVAGVLAFGSLLAYNEGLIGAVGLFFVWVIAVVFALDSLGL